jgi:hypothetical protein
MNEPFVSARSMRMRRVLSIARIALLALLASTAVSRGQIFVSYGQATGTIGEFDSSGNPINATLIQGLFGAYGIAIENGTIYSAGPLGINAYSIGGVPEATPLIPGEMNIRGIVASGPDLFVIHIGTFGENGAVDEYSTSGAPLKAPLFFSAGPAPMGLAISGDDVYFADFFNQTVSLYTTSGGLINPSLVSGLDYPTGVALSEDGKDLFV